MIPQDQWDAHTQEQLTDATSSRTAELDALAADRQQLDDRVAADQAERQAAHALAYQETTARRTAELDQLAAAQQSQRDTDEQDWRATMDRRTVELDQLASARSGLAATPATRDQYAPTGTGLSRVYRDALAAGLDDEGARAAAAVARTEGGMTGTQGDQAIGGSRGTFQFYFGGGMGNAYAKSRGISESQADAELATDPHSANEWALRGYLGAAIREGQAKGLRGAELATYAQRFGQRSESPERAGTNYAAASEALAGASAGEQTSALAEPATPAGDARTAIRARAQEYVGTPYAWGGADKQGIDCSAFISRAWGIGRQTTDTLAGVADPIAKDALQPGDALNLTTGQDPRGYGHVRMFDGWADPNHETMWVYESSTATGGVARRVIPYDQAYTPMRLRSLTDEPPRETAARMHQQAPPAAAEQEQPGRPTTTPIASEGDRPPSEFEPPSRFGPGADLAAGLAKGYAGQPDAVVQEDRGEEPPPSPDRPPMPMEGLLNLGGPFGVRAPVLPPIVPPSPAPPDRREAERVAAGEAPIAGVEDIVGAGARRAAEATTAPLAWDTPANAIRSLGTIAAALTDTGKLGQFFGRQLQSQPGVIAEGVVPDAGDVVRHQEARGGTGGGVLGGLARGVGEVGGDAGGLEVRPPGRPPGPRERQGPLPALGDPLGPEAPWRGTPSAEELAAWQARIDDLGPRTSRTGATLPQPARQRVVPGLEDVPTTGRATNLVGETTAVGAPRPSAYDRFQTVRFASMLSSTTTQLLNNTANAVNTVADVGLKPLQVALDAAVSGVTGGERTRYLAEVVPQARASVAGLIAGAKRMPAIMRDGIDPEALRAYDVPRGGLRSGSKTVDAVVEAPLRALSAADAMWRGAAEGGHTAALATRQAVKEGLTGADRAGRVDYILTHIDEFRGIADEAKKLTARAVFQEHRAELDPIVSALKGSKARYVSDIVLPFIRTPYNVAAQGVGMTPVGFAGALKAARAGQKGEAIDRAVRAGVGTAAMGYGLSLAASGYVTGATPDDAAERTTLPDGWKPYSLRVPAGDGALYVPLQALGPVAMPLGVAAALGDLHKRGQEGADAQHLAYRAVKTLGKYAGDQMFLQGLAALPNIIDNPERYLDATLENLASSLMPASGLQKQVDQALGRAPRDPKGFIEGFLAASPLTSQLVEPRLTPLGEERQPASGAAAFVAGSRIGVERDDPALAAMRDARVALAPPGDTALGLPLTKAEQRRVQTRSGELLKERMAAIHDDPELRADLAGRSVAERGRAIEKIRDAARQAAAREVLEALSDDELARRRDLVRGAKEQRRPMPKAS